MFLKRQQESYKPDYGFLSIVFLLLGIGVVMVFSSSFYYVLQNPKYEEFYFLKNQVIRIGFALIAFFIGYRVNYRVWKKLSGFFILLSIFVLILTLFFGKKAYGATRWIRFLTFSLQPSEFIKIALVLYLASFFSKKRKYMDEPSKYVSPPLIVSGFILFLVAVQPNIGTAAVMAIIVFLMFFVAGVKLRYLLGILFAGMVVFALLILIFPHAKERIAGFGSGNYQVEQARIALGSGRLFGVGLGEGKQKFMFLPFPYNDFILAVIGEEMGFIGIAALSFLFVAYLLKSLSFAEKTDDLFAKYLAVGLGITPFVYFLMHFGVVLGILPTTGLPLPFISFGGSAITSNMFGAGILFNISKGVESERSYSYRWDRRTSLSSPYPG